MSSCAFLGFQKVKCWVRWGIFKLATHRVLRDPQRCFRDWWRATDTGVGTPPDPQLLLSSFSFTCTGFLCWISFAEKVLKLKIAYTYFVAPNSLCRASVHWFPDHCLFPAEPLFSPTFPEPHWAGERVPIFSTENVPYLSPLPTPILTSALFALAAAENTNSWTLGITVGIV